MIWLWLGAVIVALIAVDKWTCWLGHHWQHVGYTDEPWLHYYECKRCPAKYEYSPWEEAGYR